MPRIGFGTDLHRLQPGSGFRLGGVDIPCSLGVVAHSDGDVLLHAVTDAILGAAGQPDIGEIFPDCDPANYNRNSADFLAEALRRAKAVGLRVGNADVVIELQAPKLSAHKEAIRRRLAELLGCDASCVGVKAKTREGLDAIGRGEAIAAQAVVLLVDA